MLGLIQLVTHAEVIITGQVTTAIKHGILALIGIEKEDKPSHAEKLIERIINYRIFQDAAGKMNLSLIDMQGGLLLVPQFTLVADTKSGTRPGFSKGMPPIDGRKLFDYLVNFSQRHYANTQAGEFGAHMQINLCNDGPVTFLLQV